MGKKWGVVVELSLFFLLCLSTAAADEVGQDIIVGVLVVAIAAIIAVVALIMVLKKKKPGQAAPAAGHEGLVSGDQIVPHGIETPDIDVKKPEANVPAQQKAETYSGFLAKAKSLQQNPQTSQHITESQEDPYKVGGFKREEVEELLKVPESGPGNLKVCKGCGFELVSEEKACPVCGRKP